MEMHKDAYHDLILRFSKELNDVGVSGDIKKLVEDQYTRTPNVISCSADKNVRTFCYRHNGYEIQATQNVKLVIKTCK